MSDVSYKIIRIATGETLIAGLNKDKTAFILHRPMTVVSENIYDKKTMKFIKTKVMLSTWVEYSSDEVFFLPKNMVVTFADPDIDILEMYDQAKTKEDIFKEKMKIAEEKAKKVIRKIDPDEEYDQLTGITGNSTEWTHRPRFNLDDFD